jgi:hypothetical protein
LAHDTDLVLTARRQIYAAVEPLLASAQEQGGVRPDVTADDVLRMLSGLGLADYVSQEQRDRVFNICLRGLAS